MHFLRRTSLEKSGMSGIRNILEVCCEKGNISNLPEIVSIIRMSDLYDVSLDELLKGDKVLMEKIEKETVKSM